MNTLRNLINGIIKKKIIESGLANAEDKQLGLFFIKAEKGEDEISQKEFADKVLKYLWHDVFKRERDVFNSEVKKFEDLIDNFKEKNAFEKCFEESLVKEISSSENNQPLVKQ